MKRKNTTTTRITAETKNKIKKLRLKLSSLEGDNIASDELMRRVFNIKNIDKVLEEDALLKRRLLKGD